MNRTYKNIIKSFLLGLVIIWGFLWVFIDLVKLTGELAGCAVVGLSIICTVLYCTYTIIDTIKEYCGK
ncbi:hypothetical protein [Clostridium paraputrificum]|uniref:hypothetical protein n=1 Tax=Clostridium paraputrificum TaxID=29363 RepID=UPI0024809F28|nr:hypothetical protein [Clostridium paraputrificum]MDB2087571.1 hypothetical protein [Clostridium paraputrificum]